MVLMSTHPNAMSSRMFPALWMVGAAAIAESTTAISVSNVAIVATSVVTELSTSRHAVPRILSSWP